MNHDNHAAATTTNPFTPAEWEGLRVDDRKAATAIVGLMVAIFLAGVVGYLIVCWVVS